MTVEVRKLDRAYHDGDWHDKPLKWGVFGPENEEQHFHTKKNATLYKRIRRNSKNFSEACTTYIRTT